MNVLLSIKPEFGYRILDGTKKFEFRKTLFKRRDIERIIIYASYPIQAVIGEFTIANILTDDVEKIWEKTECGAGITKEYYQEYFSSKDIANAIEVGSYKKYNKPKKLSDFNLSYAPQSFAYVKEIPFDDIN